MKSAGVGVRPDISQLLNEMKALRERTGGFQEVGAAGDVATTGAQNINALKGSAPSAPSFTELLGNAIDQVNDVQKESGKLATAFQQGDPDATLTEVVIASEKASVAFEAMTEVRNRLVNAYEDIMNMPI